MKTIEIAKVSICPFFMLATSILVAGAKPIEAAGAVLCAADACMMWRQGPPPEVKTIRHATHVWEEPPWDNEKKCYTPPSNRPDNVPPNYIFQWDGESGETWWEEPADSAKDRWPGFCGLAGWPRV